MSARIITPTTAPIGIDGDRNFVAGSDEVEYRVRVAPDGAPHSIRVALVYQTLGARFARELFGVDTPEVASFRRYYERATRTPVLVDEVSGTCR